MAFSTMTDGALDDLVFQGGDRQRPSAVRPPSVCTSGGTVAAGTLPDGPVVQILEPWLEVCLVVLPRHAVHAGSRLALERVERRSQRVDVDVVEKRGEPFLLPLPCGLPYAVQRLGHALPVLRPERALLVRVPLGPRPSLHRLRRRIAPALFVGFIATMAGSDFSRSVHHRLRLLAFPMRTGGRERPARPGDLPVPVRGASAHARVFDHAGSDGRSR